MMRKLVTLTLVAVMTIVLCLAGCSKSVEPVAEEAAEAAVEETAVEETGGEETVTQEAVSDLSKPLVFKVSLAEGPDTPMAEAVFAACDKATEMTDGNIVFERFPSGELGTIGDVMEQVRAGAPIIMVAGYDNISDLVPDFAVAAAPYTFMDWKEVGLLIQSDWIVNIEDQMHAFGLQAVAMNGIGGYRHFISNKVIESPADIEGMKIRMGPSAVAQGFITVMGGAPTTSNWPDNYSNIQQGVYDSCEAALTTLYSSSLYEVGKNLCLSQHFLTPFAMMTSSMQWATIPTEYQETVRGCFEDALEGLSVDIMDLEAEYIKKFEDEGVTVTVPDREAFAAVIPDLYEHLGIDYSAYEAVRAAIDSQK